MDVLDRPPHLLTVKNLSAWLGVSISTVWRAVRAGRLPRPLYASIRSPRWDPGAVLAALEHNAQAGRRPMQLRSVSA